MENTETGAVNISSLKKREPQPLAEMIIKDGMVYRLDVETQTYYLDIEEPALGKYGQLLRKYLHENNDPKASILLYQGRYWEYLKIADTHLEDMYSMLKAQMAAKSTEPENYQDRAERLNRIDTAVHELMMAELNEMILSPA